MENIYGGKKKQNTKSSLPAAATATPKNYEEVCLGLPCQCQSVVAVVAAAVYAAKQMNNTHRSIKK